MCLAMPGKIIKIEDLQAVIDYGAVTTHADLRVKPEAKIGDTVLVHAGFVIEIVSPESADELERLVKETAGEK